MYLRSTPRRNKDGSTVRYLQLAHNVWDPAAKRSRVQVVYNFGREDQTNRAALQRLVASVTRFLDPGQALAAAGEERGLPIPGGDDDGDDGRTVRGFRSFGKSKDHRDDLPQVVIGMAVTRTGIPVRIWCWPGATNDSALIRQVKDDMRDWTLSRI